MWQTSRQWEQGTQLVSLAAGSILAFWLLLQPDMIRGLSLGWRLPVWLLGVWAVGAGFFHGMGLVRQGWARRLLGPPLGWVLMALLLVLLLVRSG